MTAAPDTPSQRRNRILQEPLLPTLWWLAWPTLVTNILQSSINIADLFLIGGLPRGLATDSLAALGMSIQAIIMVVVLLSGVSVGTTALVARMVGAGDRAAANAIARQSMVLAGLFGAVFILPVGVAFAPPLLRTLGATG